MLNSPGANADFFQTPSTQLHYKDCKLRQSGWHSKFDDGFGWAFTTCNWCHNTQCDWHIKFLQPWCHQPQRNTTTVQGIHRQQVYIYIYKKKIIEHMYKKNENHYLIHSLFFLALSGPISMCKSANRFSSAVDRTMHLTQPNFNNFFQMCVTSKLRWDVVFKWCAHTLKLLGARNWKRKKAGYLRIANATCELFFFKKDFPLCYHHTQSLFSLCEMKQVLFLLNNITKKKGKKKIHTSKKKTCHVQRYIIFFFSCCVLQ